MTIQLMATESLLSTLRAAGTHVEAEDMQHCPFMVGDFIAQPTHSSLAVRVVGRWFCPAKDAGEGTWYVMVEQAPHPSRFLDGTAPR